MRASICVCIYSPQINLAFMHASIHASIHPPAHFFMESYVQRGMQTHMHPCIYASSEHPCPWMYPCIHTSIQMSVDAATRVHPILDLRLSSFLAWIFNFFGFHQFWLFSRTHTFSTVYSLFCWLFSSVDSSHEEKNFNPTCLSEHHLICHLSPMYSSWIILSTLAAQPLAFRFNPTWHLWLGLAPLHGKCSCWGISCQGLSNGLDKGVYLFIPAEALDWSWSRSICVLTGMTAGGGTWLLWRAAMHYWLLSSSQPWNVVCWWVMRSFTVWFALSLLPWMPAYTKLWPALTQCSKIGIYNHSWSSFLLWPISSVWMGVRGQATTEHWDFNLRLEML